MIALKTINYRGGIARFCVPDTWVEEYEPKGGGTFYEDGPDTGTLRINVMDFMRSVGGGENTGTAREMLAGLESSGEVEELPKGLALGRSIRMAIEGDEELLIYTWQIGIKVVPTHFRLVVFTYTVLAHREREPVMQQELQLLDKSISEGEYPAVCGEAGDYVHNP